MLKQHNKILIQSLHSKKEEVKLHSKHKVSGNLPPTVAPTKDTNRSKGMLRRELSVSHVSAKALKGVANIATLLTTNAAVGKLICRFPCQSISLASDDKKSLLKSD